MAYRRKRRGGFRKRRGSARKKPASIYKTRIGRRY